MWVLTTLNDNDNRFRFADSVLVAWGDGKKTTRSVQQKEKEEGEKGKEIWKEREKRKEEIASREIL